MTNRAFTFLVNPSSGGGAAPEAVVPVARLLRDAGAVVEIGTYRELIAQETGVLRRIATQAGVQVAGED